MEGRRGWVYERLLCKNENRNLFCVNKPKQTCIWMDVILRAHAVQGNHYNSFTMTLYVDSKRRKLSAQRRGLLIAIKKGAESKTETLTRVIL